MFEIVHIHSPEEIVEVKAFDDQLFEGYQLISIHELEIIAKQDGLYGIFDKNRLTAEAQILFKDTDFYTLENPNWAFIYGLGVAKTHRNKGLATQMLLFLEKLAYQKGKTSIYLATRPDNSKAISLWEKHNYVEYACKPHFFGLNERMDGRLLFKKDLSANSQ
jgi:ribosomal protein S18 acetylase RimI-like enzyme